MTDEDESENWVIEKLKDLSLESVKNFIGYVIVSIIGLVILLLAVGSAVASTEALLRSSGILGNTSIISGEVSSESVSLADIAAGLAMPALAGITVLYAYSTHQLVQQEKGRKEAEIQRYRSRLFNEIDNNLGEVKDSLDETVVNLDEVNLQRDRFRNYKYELSQLDSEEIEAVNDHYDHVWDILIKDELPQGVSERVKLENLRDDAQTAMIALEERMPDELYPDFPPDDWIDEDPNGPNDQEPEE